MLQKAWSAKRERQHTHIKQGLKNRGRSEEEAEEIAARTVNKERARSGEAKTASRTSLKDVSSGRRGGLRANRKGPRGRTKEQLYQEAKRKGVQGDTIAEPSVWVAPWKGGDRRPNRRWARWVFSEL